MESTNKGRSERVPEPVPDSQTRAIQYGPSVRDRVFVDPPPSLSALLPWKKIDALAASDEPKHPRNWPIDSFPIQPLRSWRRWVPSDEQVHPLVLQLADTIKVPEDLIPAITAIGPEAFVAWWEEELPTPRVVNVPELARRLGQGVWIREQDVADFVPELEQLHFIDRLREVAKLIRRHADAPPPQAKDSYVTLGGFLEDENVQRYLRRRRLKVPIATHGGVAVPCWFMEDLLTRAMWEVVYGLMGGGRAIIYCGACARPFVPRRMGQEYCREGCQRRAYSKRLSREPSRREYQRVSKRLYRLQEAGGSRHEIERLKRERDHIKAQRATARKGQDGTHP